MTFLSVFILTFIEVNILSSRSQNFTLNKSGNLRGYILKYLPYVFTKHGVLILVGILKSDIEVKNDLRKVSRKNFFNIIQLWNNQLLVKIFDLK